MSISLIAFVEVDSFCRARFVLFNESREGSFDNSIKLGIASKEIYTMRNCSQYGEMIARPLQLSASGRINVPTMMHLDLERPATGGTESAIQLLNRTHE